MQWNNWLPLCVGVCVSFELVDKLLPSKLLIQFSCLSVCVQENFFLFIQLLHLELLLERKQFSLCFQVKAGSAYLRSPPSRRYLSFSSTWHTGQRKVSASTPSMDKLFDTFQQQTVCVNKKSIVISIDNDHATNLHPVDSNRLIKLFPKKCRIWFTTYKDLIERLNRSKSFFLFI